MTFCNLLTLLIVFTLLVLYLFGIENTKVAVMSRYNQLKKTFKPVNLELSKQSEKQEQSEQSEQPVQQDNIKTENFASVVEENFNNDVYNPDVEIDADNYEMTLKKMVLEPEVFDQHKKFNEELMHRVGGTSSRSPVRDDNVDVVPWVGLKRPSYQKINPNDGSARTVPSVKTADDLADYQQIMWKPSSSMA